MGKKAKTEDIIKEVLKSSSISEQELNLLKRRLNSGEEVKGLEYGIDEEIELLQDQETKGLKYLMNKYKTPKGKERENNPFRYREIQALENSPKIYFSGYHNSSFFGKNYVPVYSVCGGGSCFDYYIIGGKVEIIG